MSKREKIKIKVPKRLDTNSDTNQALEAFQREINSYFGTLGGFANGYLIVRRDSPRYINEDQVKELKGLFRNFPIFTVSEPLRFMMGQYKQMAERVAQLEKENAELTKVQVTP